MEKENKNNGSGSSRTGDLWQLDIPLLQGLPMFARSSAGGGQCSGNGRKALRASLTYTSGALIGGGI